MNITRCINKILDIKDFRYWVFSATRLLPARRRSATSAASNTLFLIVKEQRSTSVNLPPAIAGGRGAEGDRTPDLLVANQTLSQLSYSPGE